jgi:hypothetical protein
MKLISMWEPWATLYVLGLKRIETRSWGTSYSGWVAIHSTKGGLSRAALRETLSEPEFSTAFHGICARFTPGHIIGAVNLIACHPTERRDWIPGVFEVFPELDTPRERAFGDYSEGRYGLVADINPFRLPRPIPFTGRQGKLIDITHVVVTELRRQWRDSHRILNGKLRDQQPEMLK